MEKIAVFLIILITACTGNNLERAEMLSNDMAIEEYSQPMPESEIRKETSIQFGSKLIKEAQLSVEVKQIIASVQLIKQFVEKNEGYITKEEEMSFDERQTVFMMIRVPSANFDTLIDEIIGIAKHVESKNIEIRDVTEEFVDIQARLKTKRNIEKRYTELLKRANSVEDILKVEKQLGKIREEIEVVEGRMKYLANKVNFSTMNLTLFQKIEKDADFEFFYKIGRALKGGWKGLLNFIVGVFYIWPFILIGVVAFILIKRYRKRK